MADVCYYDGCIDHCTNYNNYCQVYRDVKQCEDYISLTYLRRLVIEKNMKTSISTKK